MNRVRLSLRQNIKTTWPMGRAIDGASRVDDEGAGVVISGEIPEGQTLYSEDYREQSPKPGHLSQIILMGINWHSHVLNIYKPQVGLTDS